MSKKYLEIRALTWRQPYASLMLSPFNKIETRKWSTKYRGLVAIHAAKTLWSPNKIKEVSGSQYERLMNTIGKMALPTGKIIAVGYLVDCRPMRPEDADKCFVEYDPKLWCHIYERVIEIRHLDFSGQQGWAKMNQGFIRKNIPLKLFRVDPKKQLSLF